MSEGKQPFTDYVTKARRGPGASRWGWIVAGILAVLLVVSSLLWNSAVGKLRGLELLPTRLDDANASLARAQAENQKDKDRIAALQSRVTDLEQEKDTAAQMARGLENEMRADLESKDVTISTLQGKLAIEYQD
jgi:cell division protein FtsB